MLFYYYLKKEQCNRGVVGGACRSFSLTQLAPRASHSSSLPSMHLVSPACFPTCVCISLSFFLFILFVSLSLFALFSNSWNTVGERRKKGYAAAPSPSFFFLFLQRCFVLLLLHLYQKDSRAFQYRLSWHRSWVLRLTTRGAPVVSSEFPLLKSITVECV